MQPKTLRRIALTNWIHLVGFYIAMYLATILFKFLGITSDIWAFVLLANLVYIWATFLVYGSTIAGFYIVLIAFDVIAFRWKPEKVKVILLLEWIILSWIFVDAAFEYEYWQWLFLPLSFAITQLFRIQSIRTILVRFEKG